MQRRKQNIQKVNEKLSQLHMLKQSVPVIKNLIDNASNFDMALDLIKNT
jgi:hypothetical protein